MRAHRGAHGKLLQAHGMADDLDAPPRQIWSGPTEADHQELEDGPPPEAVEETA